MTNVAEAYIGTDAFNSWYFQDIYVYHYNEVIMGAMVSQITSLTIVYSTVYSGAEQRKNQSSASLAFVWGFHQWPLISLTNGQQRGKCFLVDDVIMISDLHTV